MELASWLTSNARLLMAMRTGHGQINAKGLSSGDTIYAVSPLPRKPSGFKSDQVCSGIHSPHSLGDYVQLGMWLSPPFQIGACSLDTATMQRRNQGIVLWYCRCTCRLC